MAIGALRQSEAACVPQRMIARETIETYSRLDLRGWNPVLLAPAADIGEEILFRGALQTLLGVWLCRRCSSLLTPRRIASMC